MAWGPAEVKVARGAALVSGDGVALMIGKGRREDVEEATMDTAVGEVMAPGVEWAPGEAAGERSG